MAPHRIRIANSLKTLGSCLILLALIASGANADTIFVNPGTPGSEAQNFDVISDDPFTIDILFLDNKTLEYEAGTHLFATPGTPVSMIFGGVLLDSSSNPIPDTLVAGQTPAENEPAPLGFIEVSQRTVFSGIRIVTEQSSEVGLAWKWNDDDRPLVGVPEPGSALLGLAALSTLAVLARTRVASPDLQARRLEQDAGRAGRPPRGGPVGA